jgi:membrane protease YdiL (CAAX protease family)
MLLLLGLFAIGVKRSGYPASFYGFTLYNWQRSVTESILFTIPILLLSLGAKWWVITHLPQFSHEALFNVGHGASTKPFAETWIITAMALAYVFISSPIQEVLFRGGLQSTLQTFLLGKHRYFLAILTSNLIFAMMHLVLSAVLAILTFAIGLFWGWLYKRHGTLMGVVLSHVLTGFWVFFILGIHRIVVVPV